MPLVIFLTDISESRIILSIPDTPTKCFKISPEAIMKSLTAYKIFVPNNLIKVTSARIVARSTCHFFSSGLLLENNYGIYYNHDIKWSITKLSNFIFLTTATNDFGGPLRYHTAEAASDEIKELQHSQHHIAWYELNKPARLSFSCSSLDLLLNEIEHQQGCISCGTCSYPELTEDHVLTSAYVKIFRIIMRNAVNKSF